MRKGASPLGHTPCWLKTVMCEAGLLPCLCLGETKRLTWVIKHFVYDAYRRDSVPVKIIN